jgi:Circularly permutated YpsA SLOG family
MILLSGGQTGVDRAALDVAVARDIAYGGWCPKGGWAEDLPAPPGLLAKYPHLKETPLAEPAQRTEWNVRDADACLIVTDAGGLDVSQGTTLAKELAHRYRKPVFIADLGRPDVLRPAGLWLRVQIARHGDGLKLAVGGPRESEAPAFMPKPPHSLANCSTNRAFNNRRAGVSTGTLHALRPPLIWD